MTTRTSYPVHPAALAEDYPPWPQEETRRVVADMRRNGFDPAFAVALLDGQVLDGRERLRCAALAGVEPAYRQLHPETDPVAYLERANEHRRHLGPWDLRALREERVRRVAEARQAGKSQRTIAQEQGVSRATVRQDLDEAATGRGCPVDPPSGKVTGKDGRVRPARRRSTAADAAPPDEVLDATGHPVPERLRAVFEDGSLVEAAALVEQAAGLVVASLSADHLGQGVVADLGRLAGRLRAAVPHSVHRPCGGNGCAGCRGSGYTVRTGG